jgi:hypothetical protein
VRDTAAHRLTLELQNQTEDAVSRRVLRSDVHQHVLGAKIFAVFSLAVTCHAERDPRRLPRGIDSRSCQCHLHRAQRHFRKPRSPFAKRSCMSTGSSP